MVITIGVFKQLSSQANTVLASVLLNSDQILSNPLSVLVQPVYFNQIYSSLQISPSDYKIGQLTLNQVTTPFESLFTYQFVIQFVKNGTAVAPQQFVGPQGPPGVSGKNGAVGQEGPIGATGPIGPTGPSGGGGGYSYTQLSGDPGSHDSEYAGPIPIPPQVILTGTGTAFDWNGNSPGTLATNSTSGYIGLYWDGYKFAYAIPNGVSYDLTQGYLGGQCIFNLVDIGFIGPATKPPLGSGPWPPLIDGTYPIAQSLYSWYNLYGRGWYASGVTNLGWQAFDASGCSTTLCPTVNYPTTSWNTQQLTTDEFKFATTAIGPGTSVIFLIGIASGTLHATIKVQARVVSTSGITENQGDSYSIKQDACFYVGPLRIIPQVQNPVFEFADQSMTGTLVEISTGYGKGQVTVTLPTTLDISTVVDIQCRVYEADTL